MPPLPEKCSICELKERLIKMIHSANKALGDANKSQLDYDSKIQEVNGIIAKYTKKVDELEKVH